MHPLLLIPIIWLCYGAGVADSEGNFYGSCWIYPILATIGIIGYYTVLGAMK